MFRSRAGGEKAECEAVTNSASSIIVWLVPAYGYVSADISQGIGAFHGANLNCHGVRNG